MLIPPDPLITGALGAALIGRDLVERAIDSGKPIFREVRGLKEVSFFE
jgi:hypothetical protein